MHCILGMKGYCFVESKSDLGMDFIRSLLLGNVLRYMWLVFQGWMERKVLFYGVYFNKTYTNSDNDMYTYHMGLAYMLAFGACFFISFLLIVKK
jgi:hypothetical protein